MKEIKEVRYCLWTVSGAMYTSKERFTNVEGAGKKRYYQGYDVTHYYDCHSDNHAVYKEVSINADFVESDGVTILKGERRRNESL